MFRVNVNDANRSKLVLLELGFLLDLKINIENAPFFNGVACGHLSVGKVFPIFCSVLLFGRLCIPPVYMRLFSLF